MCFYLTLLFSRPGHIFDDPYGRREESHFTTMVEILREVQDCGTIVKLQDVFRDEQEGTITTACELIAGGGLAGGCGHYEQEE